ncbi:MAG: hypothetical protein U0234_25930 [Sandaracinus sp.]
MRPLATTAVAVTVLGLSGGLIGACVAAGPAETDLAPDELPMTLTLSDGASYPARATLLVTVLEVGAPPVFSLDVGALAPANEAAPVLEAEIAGADLRALVEASARGGVDVPYGAGLTFSYGPEDRRVHRQPETLRLFVEGDTVHIVIEMGATLALGGPAAEGPPHATAELVGRLGAVCLVGSGSGGGFVEEDPAWSSESCAGVRVEYALDAILAPR